MRKLFALSAFAFLLPCLAQAHDHVAAPAGASVQVSDPWVRATVPQQRSTGAFMSLTASSDARLVGVASPAAKVVELHEMTLGADKVMRMRAVEGLDLPAGKPVALTSGGYHVMLIDLAAQVKEGDRVPLTLTVELADGKRESIAVEAVARSLTHGHGAGGGHRH
ncbi:MAG: copper chaperone PCu(A)C [Pseudazoarcus pumilus]|nr:copper chaperone PCu(A)C [Pseudazoarcus pumilus]